MSEQYQGGIIPSFAFPDTRAGIHRNPYNDRDFWRYHFAGLAMQGILAGTMSLADTRTWPFNTAHPCNAIAEASIQHADALLAEL